MSATGASVPAAGSAASLSIAPVSPLPRKLAVGSGTAIFIDGRCVHPEAAIKGLEIMFDGRVLPAMGWGMPLPDRTEGDSYWWAIIEVEPIEEPRLAWIELRAKLSDGRTATGRLDCIDLIPDLERPELDRPPISAAAAAGEPEAGTASVAICMASWEPPKGLFERQIESIKAQTHGDWICLISDDASSNQGLARIEEAIDGDPRFVVSSSDERLGFYANFERALSMVPDSARFVALSDQDDRWRPEKLERLLAAMTDGITLAYSDMRIVDEDDNVLSETYWSLRPNNFTKFSSLVVANTVTGAASVFDRRLLDDALPFPPRLGNAYHDHWIAQVALATGDLAYIPEALYDYVQHGTAAIGHSGANARGLESDAPMHRVGRLLRKLRDHGVHPGWRPFYFNVYCRTIITSKVLSRRVGDRMPVGKRRELQRATPVSAANLGWLVKRSVRNSLFGVNETLGREDAMLRGFAWRGLGEARKRVDRRRLSAAAATPAAQHDRPAGPEQISLKPIFLDYFTRDGSTLMMRLLSSSPQIAVEDVYPFEGRYFAYLWCWAHVLMREEWDERVWDSSMLASLEDIKTQSEVGPLPWMPRPMIGLAQGESEFSRRCFDFAWRELSSRVVDAAESAGLPAPRYTAEKHMNTWRISTEQLPSHELVVALRDPRDSWVSIHTFDRSERMGGDDRASEETMLEHVISRQRERLEWIERLIREGNVPVVRYEDLILDLPGVASRLSERLEVDFDVDAVTGDTETRDRHVTAGSPKASLGRWQAEMNPEIAATFAAELGPQMRAVGFDV